MAVREGMAQLITALRRMTDTESAAEAVETGNYWSDEMLQDELDRHVAEFRRVVLQPIPEVLAGNQLAYLEYAIPAVVGRWLERPTTLTVDGYFEVLDSTGGLVLYGVGEEQFVVDWAVMRVVFGKNREGHQFYLTARSYDLNSSAAAIWLEKAAKRTTLIDWRTDNHQFWQDQEYQHCMEMHRRYAGKSGMRLSRFARIDMR
mgnify:CR=1 FL=1